MKTTCAVEDLDLCFNDIGDEGARAVAGRLKNSSSLRQLDLLSCCIGPDGVRALADAISCETAMQLNSNIRHSTHSEMMRLFRFKDWFIREREITKQDVLRLNISISFEDGAGFSLLNHFKNLTGLQLLRKNHSLHATVKLVDYVLHKDNCRMLQYLSLSHDIPQEDIINHVILRLLNHDWLQWIDFSGMIISHCPTLCLADYKFKYEEVMALARGIQEKQDFNYSQNYYPVLGIDISSTMMTMEESLTVLGALKHCNRIRNISFCLMTTTTRHQLSQPAWQISCLYNPETLEAELEAEVEKAELVKAFEHKSMDREIIIKSPRFPVKTMMTVACPHRH